MYSVEGDIELRIEEAKKKAFRVFYGQDTTLDEEILKIRFTLGQHYNLPIFHSYFVDRTLDELIFEIEMIQLSKKPAGDTMKEIMNNPEEKKELESLFDDWDTNNSVDLSDNSGYNEEDLIKNFMETGEFITDQNIPIGE